MRIPKILKWWLPVALWAALIFYLSSIPYLNSGLEEDRLLRKFAHILEYLIFTFLLHRAFKGSWDLSACRVRAYAVVLSLAYAASDEFHQLFVPGRNGTATDILIDAVGILGFYLLIKIFPKVKY